MRTTENQQTAQISMIEHKDAFRHIRKFIGFSSETVKNMAYAYVKKNLEPLNYYHHKPVIQQNNDGSWIAKIVIYGNVTIVDKNGTQIYHSEGLPMLGDEKEEIQAPISSTNQIIVKVEDTKTGKKKTVGKKKKE